MNNCIYGSGTGIDIGAGIGKSGTEKFGYCFFTSAAASVDFIGITSPTSSIL